MWPATAQNEQRLNFHSLEAFQFQFVLSSANFCEPNPGLQTRQGPCETAQHIPVSMYSPFPRNLSNLPITRACLSICAWCSFLPTNLPHLNYGLLQLKICSPPLCPMTFLVLFRGRHAAILMFGFSRTEPTAWARYFCVVYFNI